MDAGNLTTITTGIVATAQLGVIAFGVREARVAFETWMQHRKGPMFPRATTDAEDRIDARRRSGLSAS